MIDQRTKEAHRFEARPNAGNTRLAQAIFDRPAGGVYRLVAVVAGLCGAGLFMVACGRSDSESEAPLRFSDPGEWESYQSQFITAEGRVLDNANGDITHSEGIGYALLLATHFDDRETFERIWKWADANLRVREDGLFAWRWQPGDGDGSEAGVDDFNNATDGDILIAWALLRANECWDVAAYRRAAQEMVARVRVGFAREKRLGLMMLPGEFGFESEDGALTINPSYWVFPAFADFARIDEAAPEFWLDLMASGFRLVKEGRFGEKGLPADWVAVDADGSLSLTDNPNLNADFGYNAVRVPLYLAWAGFRQAGLHQNFARFAREARLEDGRVPATWNLRDDQPGKDPAITGALAIFEWSRCFADGESPQPSRFPPLGADDAYYSASLLLLTKMALDERAQRQF